MRVLIVALMALGIGACTWPTNVALQKTDSLRAAQTACFNDNVAQFDDNTSPAATIGHYVAMSCSVQTDKLIQYVIPSANATERQALLNDAEVRATTYVTWARYRR